MDSSPRRCRLIQGVRGVREAAPRRALQPRDEARPITLAPTMLRRLLPRPRRQAPGSGQDREAASSRPRPPLCAGHTRPFVLRRLRRSTVGRARLRARSRTSREWSTRARGFKRSRPNSRNVRSSAQTVIGGELAGDRVRGVRLRAPIPRQSFLPSCARGRGGIASTSGQSLKQRHAWTAGRTTFWSSSSTTSKRSGSRYLRRWVASTRSSESLMR